MTVKGNIIGYNMVLGDFETTIFFEIEGSDNSEIVMEALGNPLLDAPHFGASKEEDQRNLLLGTPKIEIQ